MKDSAWNLFGNVAPMGAAFFSIPPLIRILGLERFGVLTIAWLIMGYFSLFDLGLGRALTQMVSHRLGSEKEHELPDLVGTGIVSLVLLGCIGGGTLWLFVPWIASQVLKIDPAIRTESIYAFHVIAVSVPIIILNSALKGIVEARRDFAKLNLIRIPLGMYQFIGPWITVLISPRLDVVAITLLAGRLVGLGAHFWLAKQALPGCQLLGTPKWPMLRNLLRLGGWMTITNVVGPLMVSMDRFVIAAVASMASVSYYSTPYEMVTKLLLIGGALAAAFFPVVSAAKTLDEHVNVSRDYTHSLKWLGLVLAPIVAVIYVGATWGMGIWISPDFARQSAPVLQILAIGVFLNSMASVPFALLQGLGRPDLTGLLHLAELPFYLALLWGLIYWDGIRGAALAWTIRVGVDAFLLHVMAKRFHHCMMNDIQSREGMPA